MPPATEKTFHGLKLLAHCGGGAYGEVWYCEDLSGQRMALKIISKTRLGDAWKRELQGVINYRRITENSPYLLRIFHVAEDEENFYYTMEAADSADDSKYVPDTLAHRLQSGPLPPDRLYPVLSEVFDGLATIHQAGFAHRDIKPDNIIFAGGVPKLSDIGLVSSLTNSLTRLAGTLDFLPPEERSGDTPGSTDRVSRQRNDLYAFGKVVYCAATGLEPGRYPSLPTGIKLSLELKLFLRLSLKLCARESKLRTCDLAHLGDEMRRIERQIQSGETLSDKLRYAVGRATRSVFAGLLPLARALRKTWWLLLILVSAAAVIGYRLSSGQSETTEEPPVKSPHQKPMPQPVKPQAPQPPPPPQKPTPQPVKPQAPETREYVVASLGMKMRIPSRWQAMSDEHIRAQVAEMTRELHETTKGEDAKKALRHAIERAKSWKGMIRCDLYDVILISGAPADADGMARMWTMPAEELKRVLLHRDNPQPDDDAAAGGLTRTTLAGRRCVVLEFASGRNRVKKYLLLNSSEIVVVELTADAATFDRRVKEFDSAVKTLEFAAPPPKYEPTKPRPAAPETALRELVDPQGRFSLNIPEDWRAVSDAQMQIELKDLADLADTEKLDAVGRGNLYMLSLVVEKRGTMLICDRDAGGLHDVVEIIPDMDATGYDAWQLTDAELREKLLADASSLGIGGFTIYDARHTEVVGRNAVMLEFSNDPRRVRSLSYGIFTDGDSMLYITLTARRDRFSQLRPRFEAALKTLKLPPRKAPAKRVRRPEKTEPEPPPAPNTRRYVNRRHGFSMLIPFHWEEMSTRYIERRLAEKRREAKRGGKNAKFSTWQAQLFTDILRNGGACFLCDNDPNFRDCVEIIPDRMEKASIWNLSDGYIKSQFQLESQRQSVPLAVYDVRRAKVGKRDCLVVECANDNADVYKLIYQIFVDDHNELIVAFSAKRATFAERKKEFDAALRTLKFEK